MGPNWLTWTTADKFKDGDRFYVLGGTAFTPHTLYCRIGSKELLKTWSFNLSGSQSGVSQVVASCKVPNGSTQGSAAIPGGFRVNPGDLLQIQVLETGVIGGSNNGSAALG